MQLRTARLCLDCEEVHSDRQCPICASESFTYLTRWVPVSERRDARRPPATPPPVDFSNSSSLRWARRGAAGVALVALTQWLWRNNRTVEQTQSASTSEAPKASDRSEPPTGLVQ
jgi:hypothetical protein